MKKYVEITLLPDAEIDLHFLWEKLYQQLHLAFVEVAGADGTMNIGVSFPGYACTEDKRLGDKLRLFAESEDALRALQLDKWLTRLRDYVHVRKIQDVPDKVDGYAFFKRLSDKRNVDKLARRRAKRLGISDAEALRYFRDDPQREKPQKRVDDYPFISMTSLSSGHKYPVTVVREATDELVAGAGFSTYGLSIDRTGAKQDSSVPVFR